jgi:AcrR family transcriptional regulator
MQALIKVNKQGQALGRKGGETRRRLLDATLALIATEDSHKLSASRIARSAGLASQSFYLYFKDIDEVLLILAEEASADFTEVTRAIDAAPADESPEVLSRQLVAAMGDFWAKHRDILNVRNYLADCGNPEFLKLRYRTTIPLVNSLAERLRRAQPALLTARDARGQAVVIFQSMERTFAREHAVQYSDTADTIDPRQATVQVLTRMLTPAS